MTIAPTARKTTGENAGLPKNLAELATRWLESSSRPITLDLIAGDMDTSAEADCDSLLSRLASNAAGIKP